MRENFRSHLAGTVQPFRHAPSAMKQVAPSALKTPRLLLRPPVPADAAPLECYLSDRRIAETTAAIPHPYPRGGAMDWIGRVEQQWTTGAGANFTICLRESGRIVGVISLCGESRDDLKAGYWIGVPHWNKGYATEALHRVLRYAFNHLRLPRLQARHFPHNPASGRVMLKAGLHFEGVIAGGSSREGVAFDSVCYSVTAADWRANLATL